MGILTSIEFQVLKRICPNGLDCCEESIRKGQSKLQLLFGEELFTAISGKTVIDFGCGEGDESVEMARRGAKRVIGIDIREDMLETAKRKALVAGAENTCVFTRSTEEVAEVIVCIDSFEHFADTAGVLHTMSTLLREDGDVLVSFGPTWYHPLGGHLFSVFPWAHLIFSEKALIRWRSTFKTDGATRFSEVAGGLNQMTIRKFERLVRDSAFRFASLELVPVRRFRPIHNRLTREFFTSIVHCRLVKRV